MRKTFYISLLIFVNTVVFAQIPFQHISNSTFNAERVASFGVIDVTTDFLEITNSTQFDNSFIPSIWAHQETDTRYVLRHFATTNSAHDTGNNPLMMFRAEIRNNLNYIAPTNNSFPWGLGGSNVSIRPLFGWENGNTQLMRILANGFVGINTTSPTALLHTKGTVRLEDIPTSTANTYVLTTDLNGNVSRQLSTSSDNGIVNNCNTTNFIVKKGGTDFTCSQIFDNGIGVGIGTINPTALFHTNGAIRFENLPDSITPFKILGTDNSGNVFEYTPISAGSNTSDYDWLKPDGSFPTSIDDDIYTNGKVGINTSTFPSTVGDVDVSNYSLFAKGGILTEEVRVALSSEWPDFVFAKEYKLEPLKNVEEFINQNKHLKEVPSAAEVENNGIALGEMNKVLLLKIEELTLYLIEMNKKIDLQNAEIEKLKQK